MKRKLLFATLFTGLPALVFGPHYALKRAGAPLAISQLNQVRQIVQLQFPPGAVLLDGETGGGLSPYVLAKIRMPRAGVQPFLAQTPLDGKFDDLGLEAGIAARMKRRGWQPNAGRRTVSVSGIALTPLTGASDGAWMALDLDDAKTAILYLYYQN